MFVFRQRNEEERESSTQVVGIIRLFVAMQQSTDLDGRLHTIRPVVSSEAIHQFVHWHV